MDDPNGYEADYARLREFRDKGLKIEMDTAADRQRQGFLSDTISPWTNAKIHGQSNGLWGHSVAYDKSVIAGGETWAEYCSFRGTKDKKGLEMFETYMPRTKKVFDNLYDNMAKEIKE